ncbi:glutathione S-transferase-like [Cloeon dipterum]|uniref:glutathione S-transferase-like n=1 Tax=Cloeon dipterum TaxID=197152 RepID=UPI00322043BA
MAPTVKMIYFPFHGLGEPLRFLMAYTGIEWTEEIISLEEFPAKKPSYPFGRLPVLEMDGLTMHQSAAILRYLARKAGGLYGRDKVDALHCDVAYDTISDLRIMMLGYFYEPNKESSDEKRKTVLEELAPMYMRNLEKLVNENGGYFVNGQLTWVDIAFAPLIDYMSHMAGKDLVADKPALKAIRDRVYALPSIAKYVETRVKYAY